MYFWYLIQIYGFSGYKKYNVPIFEIGETLRGQTKKDKLVLQEWGFCGWVGNPPNESKILISRAWMPQETMAMRRCRNRANDLIHGGRRWCWWWWWLTFWRRNYFFFNLAHPVYKMWIIQEPNTLKLWNKLHFEEEKNGQYIPRLKYSVPIFVE